MWYEDFSVEASLRTEDDYSKQWRKFSGRDIDAPTTANARLFQKHLAKTPSVVANSDGTLRGLHCCAEPKSIMQALNENANPWRLWFDVIRRRSSTLKGKSCCPNCSGYIVPIDKVRIFDWRVINPGDEAPNDWLIFSKTIKVTGAIVNTEGQKRANYVNQEVSEMAVILTESRRQLDDCYRREARKPRVLTAEESAQIEAVNKEHAKNVKPQKILLKFEPKSS